MGYGENTRAKTLVNKRTTAEGTWDDYKALREFLRASGCGNESWKVAALLMPPLDGSPCEVIATPELEELVAKHRDAAQNIPALGNFGFVDYRSAPKGVPAPKIQAAAKEVVELPEKVDQNWHALLKKVPSDRCVGTPADWAMFMYQNAGRSPGEIDPEKIPCPGVVEHLKQLRHSVNYSKFVEQLFQKMMPNITHVQHSGEFADDGRRLHDMVGEFLESVKEQEPEEAEEAA